MITDRTQADVESVNLNSTTPSKGAYNYTDLNRVEAKVKELNDLLVTYSYMSSLTTKLNWTYTDLFKKSDATRYLNNVKAIRNALAQYSTTPQVPSTMANLTYQGANDIEKILVDIETLLISMENWFVYSGVSNSGQRRLWQNRFRHYFSYPDYSPNALMTENNNSLLTENSEEIDVESVPYTMLNWIESTGSQYIDTGYKPYQTQMEITFAFNSGFGDDSSANLCGCWNSNNNRFYVCFVNKLSNVMLCSNRSNTNITLLSPPDTNKHIIVYNDTNNKVFFDGIEKGTVSDLTTRSASTIYLFSLNYNGSYRSSYSKIYRARIIDKSNNTLVRDMIPVLDENNVACLYDKVTETYFYNQGTGTFLYG